MKGEIEGSGFLRPRVASDFIIAQLMAAYHALSSSALEPSA